jgi:hypothetical protein
LVAFDRVRRARPIRGLKAMPRANVRWRPVLGAPGTASSPG